LLNKDRIQVSSNLNNQTDNDKDLIDDRENDILFHDRTTYDEQLAYTFTDFVDVTGELAELARSKGLSKYVDEILERKAKTISRVEEYRFTTYRDLLYGKPRISKVWRIATFGKITDFTPRTIRKLIQAGEIDTRISIDRMEIIFGIEDLISDGIMSIEEGDEIMKVARELLTTEQLLYRNRKEEVGEAYNGLDKIIEAKVKSPERKEMLLRPAGDIIAMISEVGNTKRASTHE
jgi:NTE family protein